MEDMPYDHRSPCKTLNSLNFWAHQNPASTFPKTHLLIQELLESVDGELG